MEPMKWTPVPAHQVFWTLRPVPRIHPRSVATQTQDSALLNEKFYSVAESMDRLKHFPKNSVEALLSEVSRHTVDTQVDFTENPTNINFEDAVEAFIKAHPIETQCDDPEKEEEEDDNVDTKPEVKSPQLHNLLKRTMPNGTDDDEPEEEQGSSGGNGYETTQDMAIVQEVEVESQPEAKRRNGQNSSSKFQCEICSKAFCRSSALQRHLNTAHRNKPYKPYKCDMCAAVFENSSALSIHLQLHKSCERPYRCSYCQLGFKTSQALKYHVMIHTGEKPHKCNVCGRDFRQQIAMKTHMYTHLPYKPHRCKLCGRQSVHKKEIANHKCPGKRKDAIATKNNPATKKKVKK